MREASALIICLVVVVVVIYGCFQRDYDSGRVGLIHVLDFFSYFCKDLIMASAITAIAKWSVVSRH